MPRPRTRIRIRYPWFLFFGLLTLLIAAWGFSEWEVRRLEKDVWERKEFSALESRESLFRWVANNRVTPGRLRGRVNGLLGDLAYHNGNGDASEWYERSMAPFAKSGAGGGEFSPALFVQQVVASQSDFARGYHDYTNAPFSPMPLNDEDLAAPLPVVPDEENAWFSYSKIPPIVRDEVTAIREWLSDPDEADPEEIRSFCQRNQDRIESLRRLGDRFALPDADVSRMQHLPDFARLLIMDAISNWELGNPDQAKQSFEAVYRLIAFLEQSHGMVPGVVDVALRKTVNRLLLESEIGKPLGVLFSDRHRMDPMFLDWFLKSEYQSMKLTLESTYVDKSPVGLRQRQLVLERHRDTYRLLVEGLENAWNGPPYDQAERWFRKRWLLYPRTNGTYAEGRQFAAAIEEGVADLVAAIAIPSFGRIDEAIETIIEDEQRILDGDPESSEGLTTSER